MTNTTNQDKMPLNQDKMPLNQDKMPLNQDTTVLQQRRTTLGELDAVYQKCLWDGITGESLIFNAADVALLDYEALEVSVRHTPLCGRDSAVTVSRNDTNFTFVNFNFNIF